MTDDIPVHEGEVAPGWYFTDGEYPYDYDEPGVGPYDSDEDARRDARGDYEIPEEWIRVRRYG